MKAKLSYKSKRNIVITVIIIALLAVIATAAYFFVKGNQNTTAAFTENNMESSESTQSEQTDSQGDNQDTQNSIEDQGQNQENNEGTENDEREESSASTTEQSSTTLNSGTLNTGNSGTTGDVPNQDYVTEKIEEQEFLVSENYAVEWAPLTIDATTTTANLNIVRPIISAIKEVNKVNVVEAEEIEYTITVTNKGNIEGIAIIQDVIPEQTCFKADSIKIDGEKATNSDGSTLTEDDLEKGIEVTVSTEKETKLSFSVIVDEGATGTITNTAIVNEEETNSVKNPILQTSKISEVYRDDELVEAVKVGETIRYIIKVKNTSDEIDITTNVVDEAPEGTTLIKESIKCGEILDGTMVEENVDNTGLEENATISEEGIITWSNVFIEKGKEKYVEFSVTVNKDRTTSVENTAIVDDMPTNNVVNPVINVEAIKTSKADNPLYEKGMIEYNITLTNKGDAEGKVTVTDNVPEGTTLVENSILIDGDTSENVTFEKDNDNLITWEDVTVGTEEPVVLSFKVTVDVFDTDTKDIVNNTATLDGKDINDTTDEALRVYIDVKGKKVWEDKDNAGNTRPLDGITIQLKANGEVIKSQPINKEGNEWDYEFPKQPKYDGEGKKITYTVEEVAVDGYAKNISEYTITNSLPNIQVEKSIYNFNGGEELDSKTKISVKEGDIVGYKITVTNTGDVDLTNVAVTDTLANGITTNSNKIYKTYQDAQSGTNGTNTVATESNLAINGSKTYIVYYKVKATDVADASINMNNTAKAVGHFTNGSGQDETVEDTSDEATVSIVKAPKITLQKTRVGSGKVEPGNTITYTITVKNEGNTNLTDVKVNDTMNNNPNGGARAVTVTGLTVAGKNKTVPTKGSDGKYNIGSLNIGQTAVITATYKVTEDDMAETEKTITNTAKAEGLSNGNAKVESDPSIVNVTTKVWKANITLNKTSKLTKVNSNSLVGGATAEYGDTIKYTITATNTGRKAGTVVVKDYIPAGAELVAYSTSTTNLTQAEYNKLKSATSSNKFSKTLTVAPNGGTKSIYFTVKVTAKPGTTVKNIATDGRDGSNVSEPGNQVEKVVSVTKIEETFQNTNVVVVLDRSRSMQQTAKGKLNTIYYNGSDQTRLAVAKQVINKYIIDKMDFAGGSEVSMIAFWGPNGNSTVDTNAYSYTYWNEIIGDAETTAEANTLKNSINNIQVDLTTDSLSQTGTCISTALRRAKDEIVRLAGKNPDNKNVVIFISDGGPEGDDDKDNIPTYANNLKNAVTGGVEVYTIGFGANPYDSNNANWKWYLETVIASTATANKTYFFRAGSDNMNTVFNDLSKMISPATPVNVPSSQGKITLTDVDTSKKVSITVNNGTPIERTATNTTYVIDLKEFAANASVKIEYYKKKN